MAFPSELLHFGTPDMSQCEDEHQHPESTDAELVVSVELPMTEDGFQVPCCSDNSNSNGMVIVTVMVW